MTEIRYKNEDYLIKFRHERLIKDGIIQPKGGRTVAYIIDKNKNVLLEAYADCSLKDCYNKPIGRRIAEGRLVKKVKQDISIPTIDEIAIENSEVVDIK